MSAAPVEVPIETTTQSASAPAAATPAAPAAPANDSGFPTLKGVPKAADPAAPAAPEPVAPTGTWIDSLSAEDRAYVSVKGWDKEGKSPADILKSYRNIERLRGVDADKLVKMPDWSKPESVAEYRAAMGVPADPTGYENHEVATPTGALIADPIAKISHRLGLPQALHSELLNATGELVTELFQNESEEISRRNAAQLVDLKREWGTRFEENNQAVSNAIAQLELSDEFVDALKIAGGEAEARRVLARIGTRLGEHKRPSEGNAGPTLMTSDVAKAQIKALQGDREFYAKMQSGNVEARRRWDELHSVAFGD